MNQDQNKDRRTAGGAVQRRQPTARDRLFDSTSARTYAVLDGARVDKLVRQIATLRAPSACLFAGKLEPSRARIAPYLVQLERDGAFTNWLFERGIGRSWGIFIRTDSELDPLRKHLRRFLLVRGPDGKQLYFRWYDPRVLRIYLPTCDDGDVAQLFGPVDSFGVESDDARELLLFHGDTAPPSVERIAFGTAQNAST